MQHVESFNRQNSYCAVVDVIEVRPGLESSIEECVAAISANANTYFEIPLEAPLDLLRAIHRNGGRAKVRTGGLVPQAIPDVVSLAAFIQNCATTGIAFKATAGS